MFRRATRRRTSGAASQDEQLEPDHGDQWPSPAAAWLVAHLHQVALAVALLFLAGVVGYYLGGKETAAPDADSVDIGFLHDMIAHHEQALLMSNDELLSGSDPAAKTFAREIMRFQSYEIGLMERQLETWGHRRGARDRAMGWMGVPSIPVDDMPGLASEAELAVLAEAHGADADALFIALMRDHHAGGVHMAAFAADRAQDPFVRDLAARMARNQRIEINEMAAARDRAGLSASPPGYEADSIPSDDTREHHSR